MPNYEYKVVPAPKKGVRAKGVKGTEGKFANALQQVMNDHGANGWEYQRTDTLPCEERSGFTGKSTSFQNMLVFRREIISDDVPVADIADQAPQTDPVDADAVDAEPDAAEPVDEQHGDSDDAEPVKISKTPTIESVVADAKSEPTQLGGVTKSDPGKTAPAPDVGAQ